MSTSRRLAQASLLIFQASLGVILFGVYEARGLLHDYRWWPVAAGLLLVPAVAGLLFPTYGMLARVLAAGGAGVIVTIVVGGDWHLLVPLALFGPTGLLVATLVFAAGAGLHLGLVEGTRWVTSQWKTTAR